MYQPNFNDPRVRSRCETALLFATELSEKTPKQLSKNLINKYFGHSGNTLSKWLRSKLLTVNSDKFIFNSDRPLCKKYTQNRIGVLKLRRQLDGLPIDDIDPEETLTPVLEQQLQTGEIQYREISDRLFNPLQFIPKTVKKKTYSRYGYAYNYDIKCAAPTLIKEYARQLGLNTPTPALDAYLADRSAIRSELALKTGLTEDAIKTIINGLLNGARLSSNYQTSIWELVNKNNHVLDLLKQDQYVTQLREDFKTCWSVIEPHLPAQTIVDKNGKTRKKPLGCKAKSAVYRKLELSVIKEVKKYAKRKKIKIILEHDGWNTDTLLDPYELKCHIKKALGYSIDIEYEIWEFV